MGIIASMKSMFLLVVVGWILVWILVPTTSYKRSWGPILDKKLNASYIGEQGTNLWLLAFPVMLVAIVGCLYLHLIKSRKNFQGKSSCGVKSHSWKRPVIVMSPLGIVTMVELTFALMFVALLVWSQTYYMYTSVKYPYMIVPKMWTRHFRSFWLRIGYVGNICYAFLFFPVTRWSSILPLVGLTSESSIKYHVWLGHISMVLQVLHSVGFLIYWAMVNEMYEALAWSRDYDSNLAGGIAFLISIPFWVSSFPQIRRKMFEVFFYTHHLYILYIFFYVLHVGVATFATILPGLFLFMIDRYLRFLQSRNHVRLVSTRLLPCQTVELNFAKVPGLRYNPGSVIFVHFPKVSKFQWHPFTVTSNDNMEPNTLSAVIKGTGSWTTKLCKQLHSSTMEDGLDVSVEGPYGPESFDLLNYEALVMVSGGSGFSPYISIIREIIFQSNNHNRPIPRIYLICAFKHKSDLTMLDLLLPYVGSTSTTIDLSRIHLQIEVYVTRDQNPPPSAADTTNTLVQTKWFKPNPKDSLISPVLGTNGWLWLSLIISGSFFTFLILLGLLTRYFIYPVDHNTYKIYHFSYWCLWDMFLVCVSIVVVTSCVFLYQKGGGVKMEGKNVDIPNPTASSCSWLDNVDSSALESHPYQSLVQSTSVHYGGRPNLKKMLLEYKGTNVGVVVSGPREMRHDVARVCTSKQAGHLHFEALSFSW